MLNNKIIKQFNCIKSEESIVLYRGIYRIEAWGAQGGTCGIEKSGLGGYIRGIFQIKTYVEVIVNVGGKGNYSTTAAVDGGYNGGGRSSKKGDNSYSGSGGGSTDISFVINGTKEKMLIAGGGGGSCIYNGILCSGGNGGGLSGSDGQGHYPKYAGKGGKQYQYENAGDWESRKAQDGTEGKGGNGLAPCIAAGGGGGGGYFGGGGGSDIGSGGGGSGFISKAAIRKFTPQDMTFYGREGDGLAIITSLDNFYCTCMHKRHIHHSFCYIIIATMK